MRWGSDIDASLSELLVPDDATLYEALRVIEGGAQSIAFVCDGNKRVVGSLTDGDVRRALLAGVTLDSKCLRTSMNPNFAFARKGTGRAEVLDIMRARDIGQLPILDEQSRLCGLHTVGQMIAQGSRPNWALILAGGLGTRLAPLTTSIPKPMVLVAGRPILERLILHLMSHGIKNFYLAVNHLAHVVEDYFKDGSHLGCRIEYLREAVPLGTGGSLSLIEEIPADPLLVVNGDLLTQCDIGQLLNFHSAGGYLATLTVRPHTVQVPFGVAEVDGDRLVSLAEKPSIHMLINAGVYVLSPDAIGLVPKGIGEPITELFDRCLCRGMPVGVYALEHEWLDVGRPEDLQRARGEH